MKGNLKWSAFVVFLILSKLLFHSCSANFHIRKAIAKDPSILDRDTIIRVDTVKIPEIRDSIQVKIEKDTGVHWIDSIFFRYDTIEVIREKLKTIYLEKAPVAFPIKYSDSLIGLVIERAGDSLKIRYTRKPQEIIRRIEVPVEKLIYKNTPDTIKFLLIFLTFFLVGVILRAILKK